MQFSLDSKFEELWHVPVGAPLIDHNGVLGLAVQWMGVDTDQRSAGYLPLTGPLAFTVQWPNRVPGSTSAKVVSIPNCRIVVRTHVLKRITLGYSRQDIDMASKGDLIFLDHGPLVVALSGESEVVVSLRTGRLHDVTGELAVGASAWGLAGYEGDLELFDTSL